MLALTLADVKKFKPCEDALARLEKALPARRKLTAAQAHEHGATLNDLVWIASAVARKDRDVERRLRMWMADCAARVLHVYEEQVPGDKRVREAIIATRRYANGEIDTAAMAAARAAAWDAAMAAEGAAEGAAARAAAWDAAWDAARDAAGAAEGDWQATRLCEWLSEKEPEPLSLDRELEDA